MQMWLSIARPTMSPSPPSLLSQQNQVIATMFLSWRVSVWPTITAVAMASSKLMLLPAFQLENTTQSTGLPLDCLLLYRTAPKVTFQV